MMLSSPFLATATRSAFLSLTLMAIASSQAAGAVATWVAAGTPSNSMFSYGQNWDAFPTAGDDLVFAAGPAFAAKGSPVNDLPASMAFGAINIYEAYNITGNAVTCSSVNDNNATTATLALALATPGSAVMTIIVTTAGGVLYLPGILSGAGPVTHGGPGHRVLNNPTNSVSGLTTLGMGTLHIWGSMAASPINVTSGTLVLSSDCTVNNVTLAGSTSVLSFNETLAIKNMHGTCGNLSIGSSSTFQVVTKGAASTLYSNITASNVTLTTGILVVNTANYMPAAGSVMTIIDNVGASPVVGTFAGLAEGAIVTSSTNPSTTFTISYIAGAGSNNVTLTGRSGNGAGTAGGTTTGTGTGTATATGSTGGSGTAGLPPSDSSGDGHKNFFCGSGSLGCLMMSLLAFTWRRNSRGT